MSRHDLTASSNPPMPDGYRGLLDDVKREITSARLRTAVAVNKELIALYWRIGRHIVDRQFDEGWGSKVIDRLSTDLRTAYPQVKGYSRTNLKYMRQFALAWPEFGQQPVGQIPWGHITVLLDSIQDPDVRDFYARRVAEEGWSRGFLIDRIKARLHEPARVGEQERVRFVSADLFRWHPERRYDVVFFGFWLSHVPPERFASFWSLVAECLKPGGRVFFVDDGYRTADELIEGERSVTIQRRLTDGTAYRIVKVPHRPADLERQLEQIGWLIKVHSTSGPFYWGAGSRVPMGSDLGRR